MPARPAGRRRRPWNKGLLIGQKKFLEPKHVWSSRVRLEIAQAERDLAIFNLAIDSIPGALKRFLATRPKMREYSSTYDASKASSTASIAVSRNSTS
jgi:hypothetical protein